MTMDTCHFTLATGSRCTNEKKSAHVNAKYCALHSGCTSLRCASCSNLVEVEGHCYSCNNTPREEQQETGPDESPKESPQNPAVQALRVQMQQRVMIADLIERQNQSQEELGAISEYGLATLRGGYKRLNARSDTDYMAAVKKRKASLIAEASSGFLDNELAKVEEW